MKPNRLGIQERREASRFLRELGSEFALILHPSGEEIVAEVHNESLGGLGLCVSDVSGLAPGTAVQIAYGEENLQAVVRHVQDRSDGGYLIGFECTPPS